MDGKWGDINTADKLAYCNVTFPRPPVSSFLQTSGVKHACILLYACIMYTQPFRSPVPLPIHTMNALVGPFREQRGKRAYQSECRTCACAVLHKLRKDKPMLLTIFVFCHDELTLSLFLYKFRYLKWRNLQNSKRLF